MYREIFFNLFNCKNETDVDEYINNNVGLFNQKNWYPYGKNESFFGVIENQQSAPVPALVEKITNSIDAILTRKCLESNIDPKSKDAPKSMDEAIEKFFPRHNWDLPNFRKLQSESIQIIADGERKDTSLIIFDEGEGQNPEDFENTFLSLLRGNKNDIMFVQGKYNMGGTGAIVFCGKKRYQLISSKRYDNNGLFGFTLIRRHPLNDEEKSSRKNTWYEYLKIDGKIPSFEIKELDLGLLNRKFINGTIIKLYSYNLPPGSRSVISRDLNQSINEFLFEPALPIYTIDTKERYPDDINLKRDLFGLKRRLESEKDKYLEDFFVEEYREKNFGLLKITCYVFKTIIEGKSSKESKDSIKREFFKNDMSVLFSINGQVHGNFTSEFISKSLNMFLLKDYLLIHVDCTNIDIDIRSELFMASRDRLKNGEETKKLREIVKEVLLKSKLQDIFKRRKDTISYASEDQLELLKSFSKNLPLQNEILDLLKKTYPIDKKDLKNKSEKEDKSKKKDSEKNLELKRFPTFFKFDKGFEENDQIVKIPLNGEKSIKFMSDVENEYFVRVEEPGELKLEILDYFYNTGKDGDSHLFPKNIYDVFNIIKSNPQNGTIKITLNPTDEVKINDSYKIKVTLTNPEQNFDLIFTANIIDPIKKEKKKKEKENKSNDNLGLPNLILVYKEKGGYENRTTWKELGESGISMNYENIVQLYASENALETIYINMDSSVLKNYKSTLKSNEQFLTAEKKYYTAIYFHSLFLFTISKNKKYSLRKLKDDKEQEIDIVEYIQDLFENYYAQFLLNFGIEELIQSLE